VEGDIFGETKSIVVHGNVHAAGNIEVGEIIAEGGIVSEGLATAVWEFYADGDITAGGFLQARSISGKNITSDTEIRALFDINANGNIISKAANNISVISERGSIVAKGDILGIGDVEAKMGSIIAKSITVKAKKYDYGDGQFAFGYAVTPLMIAARSIHSAGNILVEGSIDSDSEIFANGDISVIGHIGAKTELVAASIKAREITVWAEWQGKGVGYIEATRIEAASVAAPVIFSSRVDAQEVYCDKMTGGAVKPTWNFIEYLVERLGIRVRDDPDFEYLKKLRRD
jgi:hypothetical protein